MAMSSARPAIPPAAAAVIVLVFDEGGREAVRSEMEDVVELVVADDTAFDAIDEKLAPMEAVDETAVDAETNELAPLEAAAVLHPSAPSKSAATFGFELRNPAVTFPTAHPPAQGSLLQQPINGGVVAAQVYHRLPMGHS